MSKIHASKGRIFFKFMNTGIQLNTVIENSDVMEIRIVKYMFSRTRHSLYYRLVMNGVKYGYNEGIIRIKNFYNRVLLSVEHA